MSVSETRYNGLVGQRVGFGQCGSLTSNFFESMTGYNFADLVSNPAPRISTAPASGYFATAWDVYTQVDWNAVGFDYINNPSFNQVKEDDIFFISPRAGLPTGHTGLVASTAGNNITTLEQNVNGALFVQKLSGANSWSWYGGFDGIVRKKNQNIPTTGDDEDMKIIQITSNADYYGKKYSKNSCFSFNGGDLRYIERPQTLEQLGKIGVKIHRMSGVELLLIIQDLGLKIIN